MKIINVCQGATKAFLSGVYGLVGLGVTGEMNFNDAPGGDISLDDIFGEQSSTPTTVVPEPTTPEPAPATTQTSEPVIKTKTGTVYKTLGDAVEGIEHKDALIAQLRNQVQQATGSDPLKPTARRQPEPVSYLENQDKYFEDIADAVQSKNTSKYMEAQTKLVWDTLGPLAPTIATLSRANAERVVSEQLPEFKGFLSSSEYAKISEHSPLLADAIKSAEMNPQAAAQLPELYRVAYLASQGSRVPELIQSARAASPQVQPRPTVQSTPLAPPATTGTPTVTPSMETAAGRKALIEQMEGRGVQNLKW